MVAKLGFIVDGSGWDPANIIGSIYPQPTVANIGLLNADGVTMLAGAKPTQIGSPVMGGGYQTLNGYNAGYDTGVEDTPVKTMMALVKPVISGSLRSLVMGSYHGGNGTPPVPQGDTFVIDPVNLTARAIGSTTTGVATSSLALTAADLTKFMLLVADYSAAGVQLHMFRDGALVSATLAAFTTRAIPASTIRLGIGYDISTSTGGVNGPIQESAWGLWSGVNLTTAEKASIYSTLKSMLSAQIAIS
ncbi:hypothetical protein [Klebsiella variicola]|uniref:hypothetical protein n=1 Tax=Klebsiella variicola TaxID=244366 RepID=UPI001FCAF8BE|nr:hypothetical protein [Klebsiella variicola]MCJ5285459.1 hypothetical protein [Klebsiella variicola]MCJ5304136.1 hypothetical protein [Klebsiella variicola]MDZ3704187.1 hypothetical protein [Klebsiella variicola]